MSWLNDWTDEQLLCVAGDFGFGEHLGELQVRLGETVRVAVRKVLRDANEADEAVADAWLRVMVGKNTFVPGETGSARKWVAAVAGRAGIDRWRGVRKAPATPGETALADVESPAAPVERLAEKRETIERIEAAVRRLPFEDQAILYLIRPGPGGNEEAVGLGLLGQQDAADLLGCSVATIHRRRGAILAALRQRFVEEEGE